MLGSNLTLHTKAYPVTATPSPAITCHHSDLIVSLNEQHLLQKIPDIDADAVIADYLSYMERIRAISYMTV